MIPAGSIEALLCRLAAVSEELARQLERRDPCYLESLETREELLAELLRLLPQAAPPPVARAALERIRQIGQACQREAEAMRREAEQALASLDRDLAYADSLRRLTSPSHGALVNIKG
ncbi:MAG: hypothetical protein NZR01_02100 [Bryobacteraceae bacterium]|nr:hypothetical protein [Bryobacteraceae bacterium]